ncbi:MAG TPA: tautomerase family protein [Aliidongia sp.]|uniref:tautomerase family protein n=1 Tax=Aliidongia sp. TaxID=1914230 RepID=UPI002DDCC56D|nr:tautomerase family protein [Aliidongia sp.]HEV2673426.1 tautomerase family protein [Aliidongia sp.]
MPFVLIKIAGPTLAAEQVRRLQEATTDLMAGVLGKKPELTAVLVEQVAIAGWSVGRAPACAAAHLDAKVTAGTNSAEEKARFIAQANALLRGVLGADLPVASYVVVDELPADAWGYDGLTQDHRRQAASRAAA